MAILVMANMVYLREVSRVTCHMSRVTCHMSCVAADSGRRAHAREQNAEHGNRERQRKRVVRKVNESNENEGRAVRHVTEQNEAEHHAHAANDGVGEGVGVCGGRAVVEVAEEGVADGGAGDG